MITILFDFADWRVNKTTLRRAETNLTVPGQISGAAVQSVVNIFVCLGNYIAALDISRFECYIYCFI